MIKNLQPQNMRLVSGNEYFKLIRVSEEDKTNLKPLVLINGQMDHHCQKIEARTQVTKPWCYQYASYYQYDDQIHTPYIFIYDYPIYRVDRSKIDLNLFARSLISSFEELKLSDIDIMGQSCGGMIAALTSKNERVDKVITLHSPIHGTPLLQSEEYHKYLKQMKLNEKALFALIKLITDENFGFMHDNKIGFEEIDKVCDLSKVIFVNSDIKEGTSKSKIGNLIATTIYKYLGIPTDGIVTYDEVRMIQEGLNYIKEKDVSHFEMGNREYNTKYYKKYLRK